MVANGWDCCNLETWASHSGGTLEASPSKHAFDFGDTTDGKDQLIREAVKDAKTKPAVMVGDKKMRGYNDILDFLEKRKKGEKLNTLSGINQAVHDEWRGSVSETIEQSKIYKKLFPLLEKGDKSGDYKEALKIAKKLKEAMLNELNGKQSFKQIDVSARKMGLKREQVAVALRWVNWVEHEFTNPNRTFWGDAIDSVAGHQARMNVGWALDNITESSRYLAVYGTAKGSSPAKLMAGIAKTLTENPFKRKQELATYYGKSKDEGISPIGKALDRIDPFRRGNIAMINFAANMSKSIGDADKKYFKEATFSKPKWDVNPNQMVSSAEAKLVRGLAGYTISQTRWLTKNAMDIIDPKSSPKAKSVAATQLMVWNAMMYMMTGTKGTLVGLVYDGLPDETKETLKRYEKDLPVNIIGKGTADWFGEGTSLELGESTAPGIGGLGVRAGQPMVRLQRMIRNSQRAIKEFGDGEFTPAAIRTLAGLSALASVVSFVGPIGKSLGEANSLLVTQMLEQAAEIHEKELGMGEWGEAFAKASLNKRIQSIDPKTATPK
jgi:hypothetical protein